MVQLKPEIYQMIIESMLATDGPPDFDIRLDQQQCLARMMQASKLLCAICEPYLYKDCLVGDINLLVHDLEPKSRKESLLNRVTTLRLYHPFDHSYDEPSYEELLTKEKWKESGMKSGGQDHQGHIRRANKDKQYADKLLHRDAADKLHAAICSNSDMEVARILRADDPEYYADRTPLDEEAFARLERVIMTGVGDQSWGQPEDYFLPFDAYPEMTSEYYHMGYPRHLDPRPIPHFLAAVESVKHYCQTCTAGPLALKNEIYRLANNPETVTFHIGTPSPTDPVFPPIILGTVNRYVFAGPRFLMSDTNGEVMEYGAVKEILEPLIFMLQAREEKLCIYPNGYELNPFGHDHPYFPSTRLELYDYARHVDIDEVIARGGVQNGTGPSNLKGTQAQLDRRIGGWKGKVFLKNLEDMSPCPACGKEGSGAPPVVV